jgi:hypothetical protein
MNLLFVAVILEHSCHDNIPQLHFLFEMDLYGFGEIQIAQIIREGHHKLLCNEITKLCLPHHISKATSAMPYFLISSGFM